MCTDKTLKLLDNGPAGPERVGDWLNTAVGVSYKQCILLKVKGKGKVHPRTGHEGPDGEQRYGSTLSLTSSLDGSGWSTPRPDRFTPGKDPAHTV
jgi:hypothetical protein